MTSMEARYKVELRDRDPATVEDLILDGCLGPKISGLDDKLINLQTLSLISCGLESLEGLPLLPNLTNLDLSNNNLTGGFDVISKNCPSLLHLNLATNKVSDTSVFDSFKDSKLCELELFSNKFEGDAESYRDKLFALIPSLQILDGCDANGEEVEDQITDSEGEGSGGEDCSDEDDDDGPGLSYLDNSQLDEDETEDYNPEEADKKRGKKRSADDDSESGPLSKKDAEDEE